MHSLATPPLLMSVEDTNSIEPVVVWPLFQNNSTELVLDLPGHSAANCYSCSSSCMLLIFIISLLCKCRIFLFLTCRLWLVAGHLFASLSSNSPNCPIFVCLVLISILRITKNMFVSTGSPRHFYRNRLCVVLPFCSLSDGSVLQTEETSYSFISKFLLTISLKMMVFDFTWKVFICLVMDIISEL